MTLIMKHCFLQKYKYKCFPFHFDYFLLKKISIFDFKINDAFHQKMKKSKYSANQNELPGFAM